MSVASQAAVTTRSWTGVETVFSTGLLARDPADILVSYVSGTETVFLIRDIHFTSRLVPATSRKAAPLEVLPLAAMPGGPLTLTFRRRTPALQRLALSTGNFDPDALENELDGGALIDNELREVLDRAVTVPAGRTPFEIDTTPFVGPGGLLGFDGGGMPIRVATGTPGATVNAAQILDSTADGRALLTGSLELQRARMQVLLTRQQLAATSIDATRQSLWTAGYSAVGDNGHGFYRRVGSAPAHQGRVQSLDGAWWELIEALPRPEQFAALGDNAANDGQALADCDAYCLLRGCQLVLTRTYRADQNITMGAPLVFGPVARINAATTRTVTINGRVHASNVQTLFAGAGTVTGTFARERVSICWWNAALDGSGNSSAAIQAAVNVGRVFIPQGKFRYATQIAIPLTGVDIECAGDRTWMIWNGAAGSIAWRAFGNMLNTPINLGANAGPSINEGRFADLASSGAIVTGDWIYIWSDEIFDRNGIDGFGDNVRTGEIKRVQAVNGARLRVQTPLTYNYRTTETARVQRIQMVGKITIKRGRWLGSNTDPDTDSGMGLSVLQAGVKTDHSGFQFVGCVDPEVDVDELSNWHGLGVDFTDCAGGSFKSRQVANCFGRIGYGISINNASREVWVESSSFVRCRHAVAQGTNGSAGISSLLGLVGITQDCGIQDFTVTCSDGFGDPINTHGASDRWSVANGTIDGPSNYGVLARGASFHISDVIITASMQGGIYGGSDARPEYRRPVVMDNVKIDYAKSLSKALTMSGVSGFFHQGDEIIQGLNRAIVTSYSDFNATSGLLHVLETSGSIAVGPLTSPSLPNGAIGTVASVAPSVFPTGMVLERLSAGGTISNNTVDMDVASARCLQVNGCQTLLLIGNHLTSFDGTQVVWESSSLGAASDNNHYVGNFFKRGSGSGGPAMTGLGAGTTRSGNKLIGYATEV